MRLDIFLTTSHGFTRNKSQQFIKLGLVSIDSKVILKPSYEVCGGENIEVQEDKRIEWVSRSAGKLDGFLSELHIRNGDLGIAGANCLDVGSSTGGFTQVLLTHGANHVDAVDVGTDQLHKNLREDPRVQSYEKTDIRNFQSTEKYNIIVCDASFISLKDIFPYIFRLANEATKIVLLWKPQFEVGRSQLRKTGVPKNSEIIENKQKDWESFLLLSKCEILQKEKSTVIGEAGNQEWLYFIRKT